MQPEVIEETINFAAVHCYRPGSSLLPVPAPWRESGPIRVLDWELLRSSTPSA